MTTECHDPDRLPFTGSAADPAAGTMDAAELEARLRGLIRADLDSVPLVPTGAGLSMLMASDPVRGFAVMCEAVAIWRARGRSQVEVRDYLVTRLLVPAPLADYTWRSTCTSPRCARASRAAASPRTRRSTCCAGTPSAERPVMAALVAMMLRVYRESGMQDSLGGAGARLAAGAWWSAREQH